jgi:hypothetical protein
MHDILMRNVAVGKDNFLDVHFLDQRGKLLLGMDGNAVRIELAGKLGRVLAVFDVRNLSGPTTR